MTAHRLSCHCGGVVMNVRLSDGLNTALRCDCSFCARRGAIAVTAPRDGIEIVKGEGKLTLYAWAPRRRSITFVRFVASIPIIAAVRIRTNTA